jgi:hypothetical protein
MTGIDDLEDVLAGDPTADASASGLRGVDPIFGQQLADHG